MGESYQLFALEFNGSVKIEAREERLTSDAGAILLREAAERIGLVRWLAGRLIDSRDPDRITHPLQELVLTSVFLTALGWNDQDDADKLRDDPAMRVSVSSRRGLSPLQPTSDQEGPAPDGLASQPTLSRMVAGLSSDENRAILRESLVVTAGRRIRAMRRGRRYRSITLDIDSLPIEVHGQQEGSEYNGHYHATIYHPLVANIAETGDLIDTQLRPGTAHTAEGALDFILPLLDLAEREICQVASVRIDAGFPCEPTMAGLELRGTRYVARIKNNAVLDRLADPFLSFPPYEVGVPGDYLFEYTYRAGSWSRERRVVLVITEQPGDLFPHYFWLLTSWSVEEMSAEELLAHYRRRGKAEGHIGEWKSTLAPALSSTRRPKTLYRGETPEKHTPSRDPFAANEAILLLNALAYQLMHVNRTLLEEATGVGWSLMRTREQLLKVAARFLIHARQITVVIAGSATELWGVWRRQLGRMVSHEN